MITQAKLVTVDSLFGIFPALNDELRGKVNTLHGKNIIFCEEKISLMAERSICAEFKGSFNTDVYSFGNFLKKNYEFDNLLSKEGSSMVVKRILSYAKLNCFNRAKKNLAPSLYNLIIQLKSAGVTPTEILRATEQTDGILKNKLLDIYTVFSGYEKYLTDTGLIDQSSALSYLPEIIEKSEAIKGADIYIVGYNSFTAQIRGIIKKLFYHANSVTAVLTSGENEYAFVNETKTNFLDICASLKVGLKEKAVKSNYSPQGRIVIDNIFNPVSLKKPRVKADNIYYITAKNIKEESESLARIISDKVRNGKRYKDFVVAVDSDELKEYSAEFKQTFALYGIPYFADEKINPSVTPLATLILSYYDALSSGLDRENLQKFYKNPFVCGDKDFCDEFTNYIYKYNINYDKIKEPFTFPAESEEELASFEEYRKYICSLLQIKNPIELLVKLDAENKSAEFSCALKDAGEFTESAVNEQIYGKIFNLLTEMQTVLGGEEGVSIREKRNLFSSGIEAFEVSVIPQYSDAVFVGGYRECALCLADTLFAVGLNGDVPKYKEEQSLLTDADLENLSEVKLLIEPCIKIINRRTTEEVALSLSAFRDSVFLSCPAVTKDGKENSKSQVITYFEKAFAFSRYNCERKYFTKAQSLKEFANGCGRFSEGREVNIDEATTFYKLCEDLGKPVLDNSGKQLKTRLERNGEVLLSGNSASLSPTTIEDFYKCPYRSFISHGLKVRERDKGEVNNLSIGNLMHDIFYNFVKGIVKEMSDDECHELFVKASEFVLSKDRYKFLTEKGTEENARLTSVLSECEKFCVKIYSWLSSSGFKPQKDSVEVKFGSGKDCKYPPIRLLGGKVNMEGKIDRVDTFGKYCRIIDYKTGKEDGSEKYLFAGVKLQLYIYSVAVNDKELAGAYYLRISDPFVAPNEKVKPLADGKGLNDQTVLYEQDHNIAEKGVSEFIPTEIKDGKFKNASSKLALDSLKTYALELSENAVRELDGGFIAPSPLKGECEYCRFACMCGNEGREREIGKVDEETIVKSVENLLTNQDEGESN